MSPVDIPQSKRGPQWRHWTLRYTAALAATGVALYIWFLWPVMRQDPFVIFIAAVIVSARFFGFGPALLCTTASGLAIDYFAFEPRFSFALSANDYGRLFVFIAVSILTAGLARQRSRAETRAEQIQRQMAAMVESSDDAILTGDVNGIITSWNRGAERLYGYSAAEAIGMPVDVLGPPERPEEIPGITRKVMRGEPIQHHTSERMRKDGARITVDVSLSPIRNERGEVIGASSIAHDITAQRRSEEALRRNEKLATAGRLAAAVAHEINNPLEAVTNLIYLARHHPQKQDQYLEMAEREVLRVAVIAQQMLGFVRESSSPSPLNVAATLDDVLQLYLRKLHEKHIQVDKTYDPAVEIQGFAGELRQLFSNLILNALDALDDGGRLTLHVARGHEWSNGHRTGVYRTGVRITIADNGSGIQQSDLPRIFEPFYSTKGDSGTGLGLWLSHGIVQKHEGSIRVRSRTTAGSSGTVFSVFLPDVAGRPQNPSEVNSLPKGSRMQREPDGLTS
jgi:two-component system, chemotaxis family, CheB/CheR fusion protein